MEKYQLELIGITFNQIESGVYALILQQVGTKRRIPIIIGFPEAQAIECKLQEIKTPRPLTHDTMMTALSQFGIELKYVVIKRLPNGVFGGDIHLWNGYKEEVIDARSSDAVALAIRANAPIYTTEDVIREASFDPSEKKRTILNPNPNSEINKTEQPLGTNKEPIVKGLESLTIPQLEEAMEKASEKEDYEEAARIKAEINRRQNG